MVAIPGTIKTDWNLDNSYTRLPQAFYRKVRPTPVREPGLIILNKGLVDDFGLNETALKSKEGIDILAGNKLPEGAVPIAQAYAGHQFGYFTMLGDGRALLLGEHITPDGGRFDIQLKGSGKTPYSRGGDGRAALGPMLREYIIGESMYALGIPTTRSLAVVTTGESVRREKDLPGAILTRAASSHIRVGTFQYAAAWCSVDELRALADYTLQRHFPGYQCEDNPYLYLLRQAVKRQAALIAKWQLVGFIHGVMNTDNMTISGETIDYGPCAFMDTYSPEAVFSSIDINGRYAYGKQPDIGGWNLTRFAESLLPLLHENKEEAVVLANNELPHFYALFEEHWLAGMRAKLGLLNEEDGDSALINKLLDLMRALKADYTNTFLTLTFNKTEDRLFGHSDFKEWHRLWKERLGRQNVPEEESMNRMRQNNPAVIPRNHRVEEALDSAVIAGDYSAFKKLLDILSHPYAHTAEQLEYASPPEQTECRYKTFCGT